MGGNFLPVSRCFICVGPIEASGCAEVALHWSDLFGSFPGRRPQCLCRLRAPTFGEYTLEPLRPRHRRVALGRSPYFRICARLQRLATPGRSNLPAPAVIWGKDAVVAGEIDPRFGPERARARAASRATKSPGSKATWCP